MFYINKKKFNFPILLHPQKVFVLRRKKSLHVNRVSTEKTVQRSGKFYACIKNLIGITENHKQTFPHLIWILSVIGTRKIGICTLRMFHFQSKLYSNSL